MHVSIKNPIRRDNSGSLDALQCIENKLTCVVFWVIYYRTLCPPEQIRFYCYKAHKNLLKVREIFYFIKFYYSVLNFIYFLFFLQKYEANKKKYWSNPNRPIGHNKLASMAPVFATKCGFQNALQHKAHGKRALGITMLSNSSVSEQMKLKASRHSSLKSHTRYQRPTNENIEKKYEALNPSLLKSPIENMKHDETKLQPEKHFESPSKPPTSPFFKNPPNYQHHSDQNNSFPTPNQVVINIGNSNFRQSSPHFGNGGSEFNPSPSYNSNSATQLVS